MIEVGKNYYIREHAYHHFLGTVVGVCGKTVLMYPCFKVHSSNLDWEKFFDENTAVTRKNTRLHDMGKGPHGIGVIGFHGFNKELPK